MILIRRNLVVVTALVVKVGHYTKDLVRFPQPVDCHNEFNYTGSPPTTSLGTLGPAQHEVSYTRLYLW